MEGKVHEQLERLIQESQGVNIIIDPKRFKSLEPNGIVKQIRDSKSSCKPLTREMVEASMAALLNDGGNPEPPRILSPTEFKKPVTTILNWFNQGSPIILTKKMLVKALNGRLYHLLREKGFVRVQHTLGSQDIVIMEAAIFDRTVEFIRALDLTEEQKFEVASILQGNPGRTRGNPDDSGVID